MYCGTEWLFAYIYVYLFVLRFKKKYILFTMCIAKKIHYYGKSEAFLGSNKKKVLKCLIKTLLEPVSVIVCTITGNTIAKVSLLCIQQSMCKYEGLVGLA